MSEQGCGPVSLVPVDGSVLEELVRAATAEAAADEVTPPLTSGGSWTPVRIAWLRRFHRDRQDGLGGPEQEATWAVVAGGTVVGSVRLRWLGDGDVLETGVWLTREARGRGIARSALVALLDKAAAAGAVAVQARTTTSNAAALAVLQRLGFHASTDPDGGDVHALLRLPEGAAEDR